MTHSIVGRWLIRIVAIVVPVFLLASLVTFALRQLSGIDPSSKLLGDYATASQVALLRSQWGLDQPFIVQYFEWLTRRRS